MMYPAGWGVFLHEQVAVLHRRGSDAPSTLDLLQLLPQPRRKGGKNPCQRQQGLHHIHQILASGAGHLVTGRHRVLLVHLFPKQTPWPSVLRCRCAAIYPATSRAHGAGPGPSIRGLMSAVTDRQSPARSWHLHTGSGGTISIRCTARRTTPPVKAPPEAVSSSGVSP